MAKKVIITVTNDLSNELRMHKTALWLQEKGFEVKIIGRVKKKSPPLTPRPYATQRMRLWFEKGALFYLHYNWKLFWILCFSRFDKLLAVDLDSLWGAYWASFWKRKPLIYDSHEYFTQVPELAHRPKVRKIWEQMERFVFPKLKQVYTVGYKIADIYQQQYQVPVKVVRNIPSSLPPPKIENTIKNIKKEGKFLILYQGVVNIGRGIEEAIAMMAYLPQCELVIVGGGDKLQELQALVQQQQLSHCVRFLGHVPFQELPLYTAQADVGLCLLNANLGLNYVYALPNKIFEYTMAGVPSLSTKLPEIEQLFEEYQVGKLVDNHEPHTLAKAITEILTHKNDYLTTIQNAQKAWSWEQEMQKISSFFE